MKNIVLVIVCILFSGYGIAQEYDNLDWKGYFSYQKIVDISEAEDRIYVAAENAFFTLDFQYNETRKFSTVNGLSGETISTAYYSEVFQKYIIGHENGLIEVFDALNENVTPVVAIVEKQTIPATAKQINHAMEYNDKIYLSCNFGISVYDLNNLEFNDTYYIGSNGAQLQTRQTAVFGGKLYAATNTGIYTAEVLNDNIIDFEHWTLEAAGNWTGVVVINGELVATNQNSLYRYQNNQFQQVTTVGNTIEDVRVFHNHLLINTNNLVNVYSSSLILLQQINQNTYTDYAPVQYNAAYYKDDVLYLGTETNGLLKADLFSAEAISVNPLGPLFNNAFNLRVIINDLWVVFGEYNDVFVPSTLSRGISYYRDEQWNEIPSEELLGAVDLNYITYNPNSVNDVYVSSFHRGLLKIVNRGEEISIYNQANSGLESLVLPGFPNYVSVRILGTTFDDDGNLWVANSLIDEGIKVLRANGDWQSYEITDVVEDPLNDSYALTEIVVDRNGYKFVGDASNGLIGFFENGNSPVIKLVTNSDIGNLPSVQVNALAIDNNQQLWIGTGRGLRVLYGTGNFFSETDISTSAIIISEAGEASELMYQQNVTDIKVDGSNYKWLGTSDAGAYYVSDDGQEIVYHFTVDNSPLPSNNITAIDINGANGEVYIGTDKGIISFKGNATDAKNDLSDVYVYPNPVRPGFYGDITIANLVENARVKITDIEGNLVYDAVSEGGTLQWDQKAFGRHRVASGVYMVLISNEDGTDTTVKKIMIIR